MQVLATAQAYLQQLARGVSRRTPGWCPMRSSASCNQIPHKPPTVELRADPSRCATLVATRFAAHD